MKHPLEPFDDILSMPAEVASRILGAPDGRHVAEFGSEPWDSSRLRPVVERLGQLDAVRGVDYFVELRGSMIVLHTTMAWLSWEDVPGLSY